MQHLNGSIQIQTGAQQRVRDKSRGLGYFVPPGVGFAGMVVYGMECVMGAVRDFIYRFSC